ncbi:MAG TPA: hypothetical protein PLL18_02865, partial [Flavobacteriales bacterium]|nr:hypothetical protein [Flavobacteriales bacterium]
MKGIVLGAIVHQHNFMVDPSQCGFQALEKQSKSSSLVVDRNDHGDTLLGAGIVRGMMNLGREHDFYQPDEGPYGWSLACWRNTPRYLEQ